MNTSAARKKGLAVLLHVLAWFVLLILPQVIISRYLSNHNFIPWDFYMWAAVYGILFYFNYLWLIPKFYFKEKKTAYFIIAIVAIIAFYFVLFYTNRIVHNPDRDTAFQEGLKKLSEDEPMRRMPPPRFLWLQTYQYSIVSIIITVFSLGLRVIERHSIIEKRQKELEKEKLHSELAFLKNQVSPHFFFNTLNNIYSLVEINSEDAQEAILKLSKLMRYLLYESEHGETKLGDEIEFMTHYVDLMQLRVSKKVDIDIDLPKENTELKIPPLLFIPFIENAFKHGISYREKSFIKVRMSIEKHLVNFVCENSMASDKKEKRDENHSGIGLENVKKRLELLFPGNYKLDINSDAEIYQVALKIHLKK